MKYKNIRQIARLSFLGQDALETVIPFSTLTFNLNGINQLPLTENSYIAVESVSFDANTKIVVRCPSLASQLFYWDSTFGCFNAPIIFINTSDGNLNSIFYNPDPTTLYKFKIDKNFLNNNTIQFKFDDVIPDTPEKNKFQISFVIYDEEEIYLDSQTDVGKDDFKVNKIFPKVY